MALEASRLIGGNLDSDRESLFKNDEGEEFATVSLQELLAVVEKHFGRPCDLVKLAEGGYHKVSIHKTCRSPCP